MSLDVQWYRDVNDFARDTPWLHGVLAGYALWGGLVVLAAMLVVAYLSARRTVAPATAVATTVCGGIGVVVTLLVNQRLISPAVARTRPCHALAHVEVLLSCANDYSFPSDHCMMAGAFVVGLAFVGRRWLIASAALALLLAFSRVYTGVHYPSDAGLGLLIGAGIGALVVLVTRPLVVRLATRLAIGRLRPLVAAPSSTATADV